MRRCDRPRSESTQTAPRRSHSRNHTDSVTDSGKARLTGGAPHSVAVRHSRAAAHIGQIHPGTGRDLDGQEEGFPCLTSPSCESCRRNRHGKPRSRRQCPPVTGSRQTLYARLPQGHLTLAPGALDERGPVFGESGSRAGRGGGNGQERTASRDPDIFGSQQYGPLLAVAGAVG
jgi:hypothetical protein